MKLKTLAEDFQNQQEAQRQEALQEINDQKDIIRRVVQKALPSNYEVIDIQPIGSILRSGRFDRNSVDIGIYVKSGMKSGGLDQAASSLVQKIFDRNPFNFGIANAIVIER